MIRLAGATQLHFTFPACLPAALRYYADIEHTLGLLPHISLLRSLGDGCYRMLYSTTELGVYRIQMVCDIAVELDHPGAALRIRPAQGLPPVRNEIGLNHLITQGYYASQSLFEAHGGETQIDYRLTLDAELPVPLAARMMPQRMLDGIAGGIANWRIHEIAAGFIQRSVADYQEFHGEG
ncbi:MAG: DUF1997 domain-containing protein [Chloroflexota bacterium]